MAIRQVYVPYRQGYNVGVGADLGYFYPTRQKSNIGFGYKKTRQFKPNIGKSNMRSARPICFS